MNQKPFSTANRTRDVLDIYKQGTLGNRGATHTARHGRYPVNIPKANPRAGVTRRQAVKAKKVMRGAGKVASKAALPLTVAAELAFPDVLETGLLPVGQEKWGGRNEFRPQDIFKIKDILFRINEQDPEAAAKLLNQIQEIQAAIKDPDSESYGSSPYTLLPFQWDEEGKDVYYDKDFADYEDNEDYNAIHRLLDATGLTEYSKSIGSTKEMHLDAYFNNLKRAYPNIETEEDSYIDNSIAALEAVEDAAATGLVESGRYRDVTSEEEKSREATWGEAWSGAWKGVAPLAAADIGTIAILQKAFPKVARLGRVGISAAGIGASELAASYETDRFLNRITGMEKWTDEEREKFKSAYNLITGSPIASSGSPLRRDLRSIVNVETGKPLTPEEIHQIEWGAPNPMAAATLGLGFEGLFRAVGKGARAWRAWRNARGDAGSVAPGKPPEELFEGLDVEWMTKDGWGTSSKDATPARKFDLGSTGVASTREEFYKAGQFSDRPAVDAEIRKAIRETGGGPWGWQVRTKNQSTGKWDEQFWLDPESWDAFKTKMKDGPALRSLEKAVSGKDIKTPDELGAYLKMRNEQPLLSAGAKKVTGELGETFDPGRFSYAQDMLTYTQNLEGKRDGYIVRNYVRPILDARHKMNEEVWNQHKELSDLLRKAGIGHFYEPVKGASRAALKAGRLLFKGGVRSEKRSRQVIDAIESGRYEGAEGLSKEQRTVVTHIKKILNKYIDVINQRRAANGLDPVPLRPNYFPHVFAYEWFEDMGDDLAHMSNKEISSISDYINRGTGKKDRQKDWFSNVMPWLGNLKSRNIDDDRYSRNIMEAVGRYIQGAERIVHMTEPTNNLVDALNSSSKLGKLKESVKEDYITWIQQAILGKPGRLTQAARKVPGFRQLNKMTGRMAGALISGSPTFYLQNLTALPAIVATVGPRAALTGLGKTLWQDLVPLHANVVENLHDQALVRNLQGAFKSWGWTANNVGFGHAMNKSQILKQRQVTGYEGLGREALKHGNVVRAIIGVTNVADQFAVAVAFNSGYNAAKRHGYSEDVAVQFGDDLALKTQAAYDKVFQSQLARSEVFKTAVPFQGWVTAQFSWVTNNIFGKGNAKLKEEFNGLPVHERLGVTMQYLGMAMAMNAMMETFGLNPPFDLSSNVPGFDKIKAMTGAAGGREGQQLFFTEMLKVYNSASAVYEDGFNPKSPEVRKMIESGFILTPAITGFGRFGLQGQRVALGAYDAYKGFTPDRSGEPRYYTNLEPWEKWANALYGISFGPRRSPAYQFVQEDWRDRSPLGKDIEAVERTFFPRYSKGIEGISKPREDFGLWNPLLGIEEKE